MIDLSAATQGSLGDGVWFSDIFFCAARNAFTGGVLIRSDGADRTVFFREGAPVHAGGAGFTQHYLGDLLVRAKKCDRAAIDAALEQQAQMGGERALLGTILVAEAGVSPDDVKKTVRAQIAARIEHVMRLEQGTYQAAPGENARIRDIGVRTETWPLFFRAMEEAASDAELRAISNALLGSAVLAKPGRLPEGYTPSDEEARVLHYLEKPRKPDQLERALKNRKLVRAFLRVLWMLGALETVPAAKGIPIPKATLLKGQMTFATEIAPPQGPPSPAPVAPRRSSSVPKVDKNHPLVKEVAALHAAMKAKNHFELLGANDKTEPAELRRLFTTLAKKYHPDAFPTNVPQEAKDQAREISAALNEAYQTLTDDEKRAHYLSMLSDDRIKGDARKAELIREADLKSKMGVVHLRKREFQKAREFFKFAMEADPSAGAYKASFAWAMFCDPSFDRKEAIEKGYALLLEALQQKPGDAAIHYYTGQILKAQNRSPEALHHFKEACRADPKHTEAIRELRLMKMRLEKGSAGDDDGKKGGGALSRLFKRS